MVRSGGFSFAAMLVINPIVILFYQNCSMLPKSEAARSVASVSEAKPEPVILEKKEAKVSCQEDKADCPSPSIE